jgi:hypothetical protein
VNAPRSPRGKPKRAAEAMINGLAGKKQSDPIARESESNARPIKPSSPIHREESRAMDTTGKNRVANVSKATSRHATTSFKVNRDTTTFLSKGLNRRP